MEKSSLAMGWRNIILKSMSQNYREEATVKGEHFLSDVIIMCEQEKERLGKDKLHRKGHSNVITSQIGLFVLSCLRLTYGDLVALDDIVESYPGSNLKVSTLINCVYALLPIDKKDFSTLNEVLNWTKQNRDCLQWNMITGQFALSSN